MVKLQATHLGDVRFYRVYDPPAGRSLWVAFQGRGFLDYWALARGEQRFEVAVGPHRGVFGKVLRDVVWAEAYPLLSPQVMNVLREASLTGWTTYSCRLLPGVPAELAAYQGLAVTGRCDKVRIDREHSEIVVDPDPYRRGHFYRGLYVDRASWDGSDFVMSAEGGVQLVVTGRVVKAFKAARISNIRFVPVEEVMVSAVDLDSNPPGS